MAREPRTPEPPDLPNAEGWRRHDESISLRPIGYIIGPHERPDDTPIQSPRNPDEHARVVVFPELAEGLDGLAEFDYVWLLTYLDRAPPDPGLRVVPFLLRESPTPRIRHTGRTVTPVATSASASMSAGSEVTTTPAGSASPTAIASTADPRRASNRSRAQRRASACESSVTTSHDFRNRLACASRPGCPVRHSTSTGAGTSAGQRPATRSSAMSAAVRGERPASQLTPPESRTSLIRPGGLRAG